MRKRHLLAWAVTFFLSAAVVVWVSGGRAYVRRTYFPVPPVPEEARTESSFVAVLLPRVEPEGGRYSMSAEGLRDLLGRLRAAGCVSIGLDDAAALYARGRLLPRKAVLLAFAQDDARGLDAADGVLRDLRLRGAAFLTRTASAEDGDQRRFATAHAVRQMRLGGAWDFGLISQERPPSLPEAGPALALLDPDGRRPAPERPEDWPLRFVASDLGLNRKDADPRALRAVALRPDRPAEENARVVLESWPRAAPFADDFSGDGPGADWIASWGVASFGGRRLALIPTPRQSGVGVFLRGTETWRDATIEFELKRFQKEFWVYARYQEDGSYVRVGARAGAWYAEQKAGPKALPTMLARAPIPEGGLPARVRFTLKGGALLVNVNGRMAFGRPLKVSPAVARGRVLLGVYDGRSHAAQAVLTAFRAQPLGEEWIAPRGAGRAFEEDRLEVLREEAAAARALSPRWVEVGADGRVSAREPQGVLVRSLAGFYGCRLVPMAELAPGAVPFRDPAAARRALAGLEEAARGLDAAGLNLRLRAGDAARPETIAFLARLRGTLRARREALWVTLDGPAPLDPALAAAVDGVLRPSARRRPALEILEAANTP